MAHRRIGERSLTHLHPLADIARDDHPLVVVMKSAQVGLTELEVNLAVHAADTGYAGRGNVLFLMPNQNQMDDFARSRFDRAIRDSPYLRQRLQPEPPRRKGADSMRLKRVGEGYIYLRGADSQRQIASVDADLVILDEFDQMGEGALELAEKRIASSRAGRIVVASTPRYPEAGIDALFRESDRRRYWLSCPSCGLEQTLTWGDNVDLERALVVCKECREPMKVDAKGRWVAEAPGNAMVRGYHLSRLYSPWADIGAMIAASQSPTPRGQQEFRNSDLGEAFVVEGGGLTLDVLDCCRDEYSLEEYAGERCVMGVDVGIKLHVVIRELSEQARGDPAQPRRLWFAGIVGAFDDLEVLMERFSVAGVVIDAQPEVHKVVEFWRRHPMQVRVAWYGRQDPGCEWVSAHDGRPDGLRLNRLQALERMFERFNDGVVALPLEARQLGGGSRRGHGEYYRELRAPQRTLEEDAQGNWKERWFDRGLPDHFAHAEVYCLFAEEIVPLPSPDLGVLHQGLERESPFGSRESLSDDGGVFGSGMPRDSWG